MRSASTSARLAAYLALTLFIALSLVALVHGREGLLRAVLAGATGLLLAFLAKTLLLDNAESVRKATEKRYSVLESIPDGFFIVDADWRFTHVNERAEAMLRREAGSLVGMRLQDLLDPLASELVPEMLTVRRHGIPLERLQYFASTNSWVEIRIQPASEELLVYLRDVTERKRAENYSRENERRLRLLLNQLPALLWTVDLEGRITSIAGAVLTSQGLREEDLVGAPFGNLLDDNDERRSAGEELQRAFAGEAVRFEMHQRGRWLQNDVEPLRDGNGNVIGAVGVMLDVTEVRESADRFARLARQDAMTKLPNRLALEERLPAILEHARARRESVAVLFVDVDRFKTINDTLGHRTGDELLRNVAKRLTERLDSRTTIFRPGGDEFVVIMEGITHKRTVASIAMDVLHVFQEPFTIEGRELFVTASVGTSIFPQNAQTADELLTFADSAMYRAKESGRNNAKFYDGTMHAHVLERMGLEQDLRQALGRNELELYYQPLVEVPSRRIIGAEALLRWNHPTLGQLQPSSFIGIAEETGYIVEISRWALREACRFAADIRRELAPEFRIAVNLSPRDFYEQDCATMLGGVLADSGLPAAALDIEVTENVMMNDLAINTIARINGMGVRIVVDDFGTGYSSLAYIKKLPVDAVKIDKGFIADVTRDPYDQGIVKAIATLGKTLKLRVIAEGIESQAQWEFVTGVHCDEAQGFYFHRPLPAQKLLTVVKAAVPESPRGSARIIPLHTGASGMN